MLVILKSWYCIQKYDNVTNTSGFSDGTTNINSTNEYTYDATGSLIKDDNKGIGTITYNFLGKPQTITYSGPPAKTITYTYDATGSKLKVVTFDGTTTTTTDYASGYVYTNNALSFFGSPEGRVVKNGSAYEYQYAITDHQGNTRILFSSATPSATATTATFEGDSNDQSSQFLNVAPIAFTAANHTPGGTKVVRLNQGAPVGPGFNKRVFPGDKVDMEAYSYYESTSGYGTNTIAIASMISSVSGVLTVGGTADPGGVKASGVNNALNVFGEGANQGDAAPAAFLNYILFDLSYKVIDAGWQVVTPTAFSKQKVSLPQLTVKEAGYVFVYLSYDDQSSNYVYFDDFKVTVTPTNIIQASEYYSFGSQTVNSWTRDNVTGNNFLANGGTELNPTSQLYDLEYRNYDPILGRMNGVDPMAHKYSSLTPYNYSFNMPNMVVDVNGADPDGMSGEYAREESAQRRAAMMRASGGYNFNNLQGLYQFLTNGIGADYGSAPSFGGGYDININLDQLEDGAYIFNFTNGQLSNYDFISNEEFLGMDQNVFKDLIGLGWETTATGGARLWQAGNGDYVQSNGRGGWNVAYTSNDYGAYLANVERGRPGNTIIDDILDWLPGERKNGSEVIVSGPTNFQFDIKRVIGVTFNPLSTVFLQKEWTNKGNNSYHFFDGSGVRYHTEFGIQKGWGVNYKSIIDTGDPYGVLDGTYRSVSRELTVSYFGLTVKFGWGTEGYSIFYGANLGIGLGLGIGGSAETYYGNIYKFGK